VRGAGQSEHLRCPCRYSPAPPPPPPRGPTPSTPHLHHCVDALACVAHDDCEVTVQCHICRVFCGVGWRGREGRVRGSLTRRGGCGVGGKDGQEGPRGGGSRAAAVAGSIWLGATGQAEVGKRAHKTHHRPPSLRRRPPPRPAASCRLPRRPHAAAAGGCRWRRRPPAATARAAARPAAAGCLSQSLPLPGHRRRRPRRRPSCWRHRWRRRRSWDPPVPPPPPSQATRCLRCRCRALHLLLPRPPHRRPPPAPRHCRHQARAGGPCRLGCPRLPRRCCFCCCYWHRLPLGLLLGPRPGPWGLPGP